ncbi:glycoside hydrolase family 19 protein [Leptolyngbya sp. FACHB-261]|uniref:glycoside hydrolase family 19 protein n=1 Tax=Leptolyngbya sp. FACHB-261 TaxID=2692806 RepID=UPI0016852C28|nr:glycoside hydrolase family 19 protein [Leptolyngbya sp. FACHB-261]MBD2101264.1 glycoside hydrolase family 19 protein [Leptolyngbya sp. FACHB-261]
MATTTQISASQIKSWRQQGAQRVDDLMLPLKPKEFTSIDVVLDGLIRSLKKLPPKPANRNPYEGILPPDNLRNWRRKASDMLDDLLLTLPPAYQVVDGTVDDLIRKLSSLPARPQGRPPYAGLFPAGGIVVPAPAAKVQFITAAQLKAIVPTARLSRVNLLTPAINQTMKEFGITTKLRQAHFIAQIAHESGSFNYMEEIASGRAYEGRRDLGNTKRGDGVRFKGRGLIQMTGRANYVKAGSFFKVDFTQYPTLMAAPEFAVRSAGWYWDVICAKERGGSLNIWADRDDILTITKKINGGRNGLPDRKHHLARAKKVLGI